MILGIASWFIFHAILGIAAVIMGAMALHGIKRRPEKVAGKGRAITGICSGSLGVVITVVLLVTLPIAREKARRAVCQLNLRQIGLALEFYANQSSGYYPTTLDKLVLYYYLDDATVLLCRSCASYEADARLAKEKLEEIRLAGWSGTTEATLPLHYVYIPYERDENAGRAPVLFDRKENHDGKGRNVLYLLPDRHCQWLEETSLRAEFEAAAANNATFKKYLEEHGTDSGR